MYLTQNIFFGFLTRGNGFFAPPAGLRRPASGQPKARAPAESQPAWKKDFERIYYQNPSRILEKPRNFLAGLQNLLIFLIFLDFPSICQPDLGWPRPAGPGGDQSAAGNHGTQKVHSAVMV